MANEVYANGREICCKKAAGKSICAFPDVCMTPPENPATPPGVPVPYPNTAYAKDVTSGSKNVLISGKEILLKNKSYIKKSVGDEAGCAAKKGVITSKNRGKAYFNSWSMDVKVEGENAARHLDMTTHNHGSFPSNEGPWPYIDAAALAEGGACEGVSEKYKMTPYGHGCEEQYDDNGKTKNKTPHHVIPDRQMKVSGGGKRFKNYSHYSAPCLCVTGSNQHSGEHRDYHEVVDTAELEAHNAIKDASDSKNDFTYEEARENAVESVSTANNLVDPEKTKVEGCIRLQLDNFYKKRCKARDSSSLKTSGKRGKRVRPSSASPQAGGA